VLSHISAASHPESSGPQQSGWLHSTSVVVPLPGDAGAQSCISLDAAGRLGSVDKIHIAIASTHGASQYACLYGLAVLATV
jgi:hypothetical protein